MQQIYEVKVVALTRGDLADEGKKTRSNNELQEVSRGHSTKEKKKTWEGPNNHMS